MARKPAPQRTISRLLIANRGEIAVRIIRAARSLGMETVAVHGTVDASAPHVAQADRSFYLGDEAAGLPYLDVAALLRAARATGADAVHPGYGFLAERADFADAVIEAGLVWVGPPPAVMRAVGDKDAARRKAAELGIPVVPGVDEISGSDTDLVRIAEEVGFPALIKAVAGGGGRGMRRVDKASALPAAIAQARGEAEQAFGDGRLLVERYIADGRHVEVQIVADQHGACVHLGERDCSVQRRHQKLIEESPAPGLDGDLRDALCADAVRLATSLGYVGAGTVEFLVDVERGSYHFLEVNARIQVEHPVSELVTGVDLVVWQLRIAEGTPLPLGQDDIVVSGHAIEARLCAEDPYDDFRPQAGEILLWQAPDVAGVRVDHGLGRTSVVSVHYDSMVAKIIAHGRNREGALRRLRRALSKTVLLGVRNNRDHLLEVLHEPDFIGGLHNTRYLGKHPPVAPPPHWPDEALFAAAALTAGAMVRTRFRNVATRPDVCVFETLEGGVHVALEHVAGTRYRAGVSRDPDPLLWRAPRPDTELELLQSDVGAGASGRVVIRVRGVTYDYHVARSADGLLLMQPGDGGLGLWLREGSLLPEPQDATLAEGAVVAPSASVVTEVHVADGDHVEQGDALVTVEAMKMLSVLRAATDGVVAAVDCAVGDAVDGGRVLVQLAPFAE